MKFLPKRSGIVPLPLPCDNAFGLFHVPAVSTVHQDQTRQAQCCIRPKGCGKEARQLLGIYLRHDRVFHLFSRNLYEAIGGENVHFRRVHSSLPEQQSDQIFSAFFTTKRQGIGIDPSIGRSIVELHGGRLWAEKNTGCGTIFLFTLPAAGDARYMTK